MAEVGMQAPTKRKCQREGCPHYIPSWRNGRRVSSKTKFHSKECKQKAAASSARVGWDFRATTIPE
jgi:hypothetical protein